MKAFKSTLLGLCLVQSALATNLEPAAITPTTQNVVTLNDAIVAPNVAVKNFMMLSAEDKEQLLGDHKDNGGDAIRQNDSFVLRDFLMSNFFQEVEGRDIFKVVPSFKELLKDIYKVRSEVVSSLITELDKIKFVLVKEKLPVLPSFHTSLSGTEVDLQVAIRRENMVIISLTSLELIEDPEYLILHELVHGLVEKYEEFSPMKHTVVRSLVNFIKNHLATQDTDTVRQVFEDHGVDIYIFDHAEYYKRTNEILATDNDLSDRECSLLFLRARGSKTFYSHSEEAILRELFKGPAKCDGLKINVEEMYFKGASKEFTEEGMDILKRRYPYVYEVNTDRSGILSGVRKIVKEQCKEYAADSLKTKIKEVQALYDGLVVEEKKFIANFKVNDEIDELALAQIERNLGHYRGYTEGRGSIAGGVQSGVRIAENQEEVRQNCRQRFPFMSFKN